MGEIEEASNQPIEQIDKNEEIESNDLQKILHIKSMFEDWFLDYASYVKLDRAFGC